STLTTYTYIYTLSLHDALPICKDFQTEFLTNLHDFVIFLPGEITGFLMDRIPLQSQSDNVKTQLFLDLPEVIAMLASRRIRRSEIGGTCQIAGGFMHRRKSHMT